MAGCGVMQLAHIPGIPEFFIHNGAPEALVGCLAYVYEAEPFRKIL
jgi:hypothetical protein